ncbi:MAG TPA: hypothetical protein VJ691_13215 [Vicinamibacterales bacterium]|nr:hypothetical protein [Vicinamibacterales bacterium]
MTQVRTVSLRTHTAVPGFSLPTALGFTGVDLLSAIGRACTRPEDATAPSALFPLLKYVESVAASGSLALSDDIGFLDRHKKTVLSDEFGSGAALMVAERLLKTPKLLDVETGLTMGVVNTNAPRSRRPDFVGTTMESPPRVLVIEAKGTQSPGAYFLRQVIDGCDQLQALNVAGSWTGLSVVRVAIGLRLRRASQSGATSLVVSDPERAKRPRHRLSLPDLTSIPRVHYARIAALIGDYEELVRLFPEKRRVLRGTVTEIHRLDDVDYVGSTLEVRGPGGQLRMFAGLRLDVRDDAAAPVRLQTPKEPSNISVSPDGFLLQLSEV